jgi:hypothetical protein
MRANRLRDFLARLAGPCAVAALACAAAIAVARGEPGAAPAGDARPPAWADDFVARVEALALLQTLNADLLSHDSATLTLDRWCAAHRLASPAKIVAIRDKAATKPITADQRRALGVGPDEPIRYRRVKLACGSRVLSEADNWYVPSRLTPEINRQLETGDIAFGRAAQPLHFHRRTLSAKLLWSPLPDGWETAAAPPAIADPAPGQGTKALAIPHAVLEHQAVLVLPDGSAISEVIETYTDEVLGFPQPRAPGTAAAP